MSTSGTSKCVGRRATLADLLEVIAAHWQSGKKNLETVDVARRANAQLNIGEGTEFESGAPVMAFTFRVGCIKVKVLDAAELPLHPCDVLAS